MTDKPKNIAASVHARLLNIAREKEIQFNLILPRYGIERLLYRISRSKHCSRFVLKGAMLFTLWSDLPHRSTKDLDLLGFGDSSIKALSETFKEICLTKVEDDGLRFDDTSVEAQEIKSLDEYVGTRITLLAYLASAKIPLQVDIGIGDAVVPPAEEVTYPVLLEQPAPRLHVYCMETVIAEKLHAMVTHGMQNTRMKDYFDLYYLSRHFDFEFQQLRLAIVSTFERRGKQAPKDLPIGLTATFGKDPLKNIQWNAFMRKMVKENESLALTEVVDVIADFIMPVLNLEMRVCSWKAQGPWY